MHKDLINFIKKVGVSEEMIRLILNDDVFNSLSKHNDYWCDLENPISDEKFHDLRLKLCWFQNQLETVIALLDLDEEGYDETFYGDN